MEITRHRPRLILCTWITFYYFIMGSRHEQHLKNPRYRNWVKAGLALKYLKDGIQEFVDDEVKDQQRLILEEVRKEIGKSDATCNECPIDILRPAHPRGSCGLGPRCFCHKTQHRRRPCPNDVCGRIFDRIVQQHMHGRPSWGNTDSTKWCTSHWEIAKCFLDGGGYEDKVSAADTDCKGLLSVVTNNMVIQKSVDTPIDKFEPKTDVFSKTKEARNEILHLASLELLDGKLDDYVDVMIQLLGDKGKLHEREQAKEAISTLKQLKENNLNISVEDELEVRASALKAIEEKKQEALDEIDEKQSKMFEQLQIGTLQETLCQLSKTTKEETQSLSNRQESLSHRQESLSNRQESLSDRQGSLSNRQESLSDKQESLSNRQESLSNRHESLEHRQTLLERKMEQMQELQSETSKQISDLHKDLSDLKTSSDEMEMLHKKKLAYLKRKKVLKDKLSCLYSKHLSTIPVPPLLKKLDLRVDDFYMELKICEDQEYESRSNEDAKQAGKKIVRNHKDIFYKQNKRVENIYVLGDAGVGKSTWCLKLIDTWLKANKQEGKSTNDQSPNEILMLEFDVVLFVSLRHASEQMNLIDMICNQIFLQTPDLLLDAEEVLKAEPEKCLVIVDGLDEWNPPDEQMSSPLGQDPSLPGRKDMNHCTVLTTTRPWKLDEIMSSYSVIDRAVVIRGFVDSDSIRNFAGKVINKLSQKASPAIVSSERNLMNVEDFEMEVQKRLTLRKNKLACFPDMMKIPLIVIFMVIKWFEDGSLERTMAGNYSTLLENMLDREEGYRNLKPRYGQRPKYEGRLSCVPYLEQAKTEWSKEVDMLPDCLKKRPICKHYSGLIQKLSKIAFEGLFEKKGNTLIFIEESLLKSLSPEELEVSVKSGILSKTDDIGGQSIGMSKFSFLHKTVQEYMSAIYLVAHENDDDNIQFQTFEKYCITYKKIYEMENVILFVCGLGTSLATKLLKHVSSIEQNRMCFNEHDHFSEDHFWNWLQEIREATSGMPMPVVINSIHITPHFREKPTEEFLYELLEANADNIRYLNVSEFVFPNLTPLKHFVFPNLTTLKLERCTCTGITFPLKNLRNLILSEVVFKDRHVCNTDQFPQRKIDFSASTNIENVKIDNIKSFGHLVIPGIKLKLLMLQSLNQCLITVLTAVTAIKKTEQLKKDNCLELEKSQSTLSCVYQTIDNICIKHCDNLLLDLKNSFNLKEANIATKSAQVSSLNCIGTYDCRIAADSNILIESVFLFGIQHIPYIPWQNVVHVTLEQMRIIDTYIYIDILRRLRCSQSLMSLHCIGGTKKLISELENTLQSACNIETLEISHNLKTCNTLNVQGIKHLTLKSKSIIAFLPNIDRSISNNVESLQLSTVCTGPEFVAKPGTQFCTVIPKKVIELVQSFVNLKCLKCEAFSGYEFNTLGKCFPYLPHLQEFELSEAYEDEGEQEFTFSCLENIKNLKILSLAKLSNRITYRVAETFPNLGLEELKIVNCFPDEKWDFIARSYMRVMQLLQSLKLLKTLSVNGLKEHFLSFLMSTVQKMRQIESITLISGNYIHSINRPHSVMTKFFKLPLNSLRELTQLKTLVLQEVVIEKQNWQAFVKCLPTEGQLQTMTLQDAKISNEETEELIKSTSVFESQEWEWIKDVYYNIVLKTKK